MTFMTYFSPGSQRNGDSSAALAGAAEYAMTRTAMAVVLKKVRKCPPRGRSPSHWFRGAAQAATIRCEDQQSSSNAAPTNQAQKQINVNIIQYVNYNSCN